MKVYRLAGFVADTVGDEGHLIEAAPVVSIGDELWLARGTGWSTADLKKASEYDKRYLNLFADLDDDAVVSEGDTVWVAGRNFYQDVSAFEELKFQDLSMAAWHTHARGQRWSAGSTSAFDEFAVRLANFFEGKLHNYLFDRLEKSLGHAGTAFRVYNALPIADSSERELNRALYFFEVRDLYSYNFVKAEAVAARLFRNEQEFSTALHNLRDMLKERRLSEGVVTPQKARSFGMSFYLPTLTWETQQDPALYLRELRRKYRASFATNSEAHFEVLEQAERHVSE